MIYFSFYITVSLQQMNFGMRKHIVFNSCLKTVLSVYVACRDPSFNALNTIVGTLAVREQAFMYMILYGQGSRELETYLPTSDNQVTISQNFNKYQLNLFMLSS